MSAPPFERRRALVTGASGGIGGAVALALAGAGAELVLTYSSHRGDVEAASRSVRELGSPEPHVIQADLGVPDAGGGGADTARWRRPRRHRRRDQ